MECNVKKSKGFCNCSYKPCSRKGICCECITYHKQMGELPACFFSNEVERTYNRSVERFISAYQSGKGF